MLAEFFGGILPEFAELCRNSQSTGNTGFFAPEREIPVCRYTCTGIARTGKTQAKWITVLARSTSLIARVPLVAELVDLRAQDQARQLRKLPGMF